MSPTRWLALGALALLATAAVVISVAATTPVARTVLATASPSPTVSTTASPTPSPTATVSPTPTPTSSPTPSPTPANPKLSAGVSCTGTPEVVVTLLEDPGKLFAAAGSGDVTFKPTTGSASAVTGTRWQWKDGTVLPSAIAAAKQYQFNGATQWAVHLQVGSQDFTTSLTITTCPTPVGLPATGADPSQMEGGNR